MLSLGRNSSQVDGSRSLGQTNLSASTTRPICRIWSVSFFSRAGHRRWTPKDRSLIPPPVMTHPDRWRLDQLLDWEEKRIALAEAALETLTAPAPAADGVTETRTLP